MKLESLRSEDGDSGTWKTEGFRAALTELGSGELEDSGRND